MTQLSDNASKEMEFRRLFAWLASCYPNNGLNEAAAASYWVLIREFPMGLIKSSLLKLAEEHRDFFPSAGRVSEMVRLKSKTWRENPRQMRMLPATATRPLPTEPKAQARYVSEGRDEAEKLARLMEIEMARGSFDASKAAKAIAAIVSRIG